MFVIYNLVLNTGFLFGAFFSDYNKNMIQRLQNRAARIITGNFDYINVRGFELVRQLGWQPIEKRRNYYVASLMQKCMHGSAPIHLKNDIVMNSESHEISTRASANSDVLIPTPNCELFKRSFKYQSAKIWNGLPPELKTINDYQTFKLMYKRLYFR